MDFKSVLLLKVPFCTHPDSLGIDEDIRTKLTFKPVPSLALAALCGFIDKYKTLDYDLRAIDVNIEAYTEPEASIDISSYMDLLTDAIKTAKYDVLALSAPFVFNVKWVETAIKLSKIYHPNAKIIFGGGYATIFPERCLKTLEVDDLVVGEGESAILHILNKYSGHHDPEFEEKFPIEGHISKNEKNEISVYKQRSNFIDLGYIPIPAWHYLDVESYFKRSGIRVLPIEATRGCPYNCSYCCTYLSWGRRIRNKPIENVIGEIRYLKDKYNVNGLHFIDDNLSFNRVWFKEILERLITMKLPIKFIVSSFSIKHLDEELIDLMIKVGMDQFGVAVESGSTEIQKSINKNLDFNKVREVLRIMKSRNVRTNICWMIGFPNETIEQINTTFNFARELRANSNQFLTVLPYPGTKLFEDAKNANLLIFQDDELDKFDTRRAEYLKSNEWNYDQLRDMIYNANIELNFLNNPLLDTVDGREYFFRYLEQLLVRLPEHIIARIVLGYMYKQEGFDSKCEALYKSAFELFEYKNLYDTNNRYLFWDHPIINDFNKFIRKNNLNTVFHGSLEVSIGPS